MRAMGKIISTGLMATTLLAGMTVTSAPALARDWGHGDRHYGHHHGGGDDGALIVLGAIVGLGALAALSSSQTERSYAPPPRVVYEDEDYAPRRCQEFQRDEYRHGTIYRSYYTACQAPNGRWYPQ